MTSPVAHHDLAWCPRCREYGRYWQVRDSDARCGQCANEIRKVVLQPDLCSGPWIWLVGGGGQGGRTLWRVSNVGALDVPTASVQGRVEGVGEIAPAAFGPLQVEGASKVVLELPAGALGASDAAHSGELRVSGVAADAAADRDLRFHVVRAAESATIRLPHDDGWSQCHAVARVAGGGSEHCTAVMAPQGDLGWNCTVPMTLVLTPRQATTLILEFSRMSPVAANELSGSRVSVLLPNDQPEPRLAGELRRSPEGVLEIRIRLTQDVSEAFIWLGKLVVHTPFIGAPRAVFPLRLYVQPEQWRLRPPERPVDAPAEVLTRFRVDLLRLPEVKEAFDPFRGKVEPGATVKPPHLAVERARVHIEATARNGERMETIPREFALGEVEREGGGIQVFVRPWAGQGEGVVDVRAVARVDGTELVLASTPVRLVFKTFDPAECPTAYVDFGTTNTTVAWVEPGADLIGVRTLNFPSLVSQQARSAANASFTVFPTWLTLEAGAERWASRSWIGEDREWANMTPPRKVTFHREFKRNLGNPASESIHGAPAGELTSLFLRRLLLHIQESEIAKGRPLKTFMVTRPTTLTAEQRKELDQALARLGGHVLRPPKVCLDEANACAYSRILDIFGSEPLPKLPLGAVIMDWGGGTFDVTVLVVRRGEHGRPEVIPGGVTGVETLGGKDVTAAIADMLAAHLNARLDGGKEAGGIRSSFGRAIVAQGDALQREIAERNEPFLQYFAENFKVAYYGQPITDVEPGWFERYAKQSSQRFHETFDRFVALGDKDARPWIRSREGTAVMMTGEQLQPFLKILKESPLTSSAIDAVIRPVLVEAFARSKRLWMSARGRPEFQGLGERPEVLILAGSSNNIPLVRRLLEDDFGTEHGFGIPASQVTFDRASAKTMVAVGAAKREIILADEGVGSLNIEFHDPATFVLLPIVYRSREFGQKGAVYLPAIPAGTRIGTEVKVDININGPLARLSLFEDRDGRASSWEPPAEFTRVCAPSQGKELLGQVELRFNQGGEETRVERIGLAMIDGPQGRLVRVSFDGPTSPITIPMIGR